MHSKKEKFPKLIFIVEDNQMYAKSLQYFLQNEFPESVITIFPVGELCVENLHLNPDYIIMDYFLNSRHYHAADGMEIIRQIKNRNIRSEIIVLSSQQNVDVAVEAVRGRNCEYIVKNNDAFGKVYSLINESSRRSENINSLL